MHLLIKWYNEIKIKCLSFQTIKGEMLNKGKE